MLFDVHLICASFLPRAGQEVQHLGAEPDRGRDLRLRHREHLRVPALHHLDEGEHVLQPLARGRADRARRARRRRCRPCSTASAGSISRSLRPAAMRRNISQTSVSASKWSRRSPRIGTRRIRFQASSSLIELETLERASAERVGDLVGGERPLRQVEQRVDLADRAVDAPLPAHLAPMQHEALQRDREGFPVVGNFCHDRNI